MTVGNALAVTAPASPTRPKPAYKAPCNNCGRCCTSSLCGIGKLMFKTDVAPCPALQWDKDGGSACGLIADPARYAPTRARAKGVTALREAMKLTQGAGKGCSMPAPGEATDFEWIKSIRGAIEQRLKARKIWGIPNDATPSMMDRDRLVRILDQVGRTFAAPAWFCVIGSAPGILRGQPGRQTQDIDLWGPESDFDEAALRRVCRAMGIEVYADGEKHGPDRDSYIEIVERGVSVRIMERAYFQIVQPGAVSLPEQFPVEMLGQYGRLHVMMPAPALLCALNLARGNPKDVDDAIWWATERGLHLDHVQAAIDTLPKPAQRDAATRNMVRIASVPDHRPKAWMPEALNIP
jgi:hypothetical protein